MKQKFPMPKRIVRCVVMVIVSLLLAFGMILLGAHLTGYRETEDFTDIDKKIFVVLMAADAVFMLLYIVFIFAAARMLVMRKFLLDKRRERFGADGNIAVYHPCEDVWYDRHGAKRALSYKRGKLILVLVERYEHIEHRWKPTAMCFYDCVQELERALRTEHGIEWENKPEVSETQDCDVIHVSIEDEENERICVSIEDCDN